ncbi:PREDICTED: methyltransferase-like protein 6 [Ceratosolen solmsi marchali]|uniref:tRNA N(3)-methylcytidine methyltransferase n=1 Tax=Ceratosolen solmsi marchali TaxID=326594 RepID=A0AAJ6VLJ4_9HYME|nr:PREDICTED: methyltransferase-like protein 6 [Ceratosolen solmsi marchali]
MENESNEKEMCIGHVAKPYLSVEEINKMKIQNSRLISGFQALQLEKNAKKYWDLFYKRNEDRFFKDRHWTTREFKELLGLGNPSKAQRLLEVGCGVGNLIYPLLEDNINFEIIYACDLSPRAIEFVKNNKLFNPKIVAFQTDITTTNCFEVISNKVHIAVLIFVLSSIHPDKFKSVLNNLYPVLDNNGVVLFRDYGQYDMTQLRFKPGHKISENFYMRQDGTRSYFFTIEEVQNLFESTGFKTITCSYIERRTINLKENIDVPRIFVQAKFMKV